MTSRALSGATRQDVALRTGNYAPLERKTWQNFWGAARARPSQQGPTLPLHMAYALGMKEEGRRLALAIDSLEEVACPEDSRSAIAISLGWQHMPLGAAGLRAAVPWQP